MQIGRFELTQPLKPVEVEDSQALVTKSNQLPLSQILQPVVDVHCGDPKRVTKVDVSHRQGIAMTVYPPDGLELINSLATASPEWVD